MSNQTLTVREIEVLRGISNGRTSKEIASQLYLSAHTVITHRKKLLEKLQARMHLNWYGRDLKWVCFDQQ